MESMFEGCKRLTSLDLSNFITNEVNNMNYLFKGCSNVKILNLKNFVINKNCDNKDMFERIKKDECKLITQNDDITKLFYEIKK